MEVLLSAEKNMEKVFSGLGSTPYAKITEKILEFLKDRKRVSRSELLVVFYRDLDMNILEVIEKTLSAMKVIKVKIDPTQNETYYVWNKTE